MKFEKETLRSGLISPDEYSCIPHMICFADFNTNYPNPNRIDRIASEIDEYLNWKGRCMEVSE